LGALQRTRDPDTTTGPVLNPELVGRKYPESRWPVTAEAVRAYALAVNDDNPAHLDEDTKTGLIAPPMFVVAAAAPSEILPLSDEKLTGPSDEFFRRMVRGDNDITWNDVIHPGDVLVSSAVVAGVETKSNGELLRVDVTLRRDGREVARVGCGYFLRSDDPKTNPKGAGSSPQMRGPVVHAVDMTVTADQPKRYAEASGDRTPIHLDEQTARLFGHPGIILQGSCTMAFVGKAVVDGFCEGNPARLKRLRVRYARPVMPGDVVTTIFWRLDDNTAQLRYGIESKKQDGTVVIKNAYAEIAKP